MIFTFKIILEEIDCLISERKTRRQSASDRYTPEFRKLIPWLESIGAKLVCRNFKESTMQEIDSNNKLTGVVHYQATVSILVRIDTEMEGKDYDQFEFEC